MPDWLGQSADPDDAFGNIRPTEMLSASDDDPLFGDEPGITDGNRIGLMPQAEQKTIKPMIGSPVLINLKMIKTS